jgi:pyruvate formate lyase activating enzyme
MNIGGFQSYSLCDFPGKVSAVIFIQGCNFRCPYCHNQSLLPSRASADHLIPAPSILERLEHRRDVIDGVVLCGGEPTLQTDLPEFTEEICRMGYAVKLDTNGSRPHMMKRLLDAGLLDYVAMDIKAPWTKYALLAGNKVAIDDLQASIRLLNSSGVEHEYRTTFIRELLTQKDMEDIKALLPAGTLHRIQEEIKPRISPIKIQAQPIPAKSIP